MTEIKTGMAKDRNGVEFPVYILEYESGYRLEVDKVLADMSGNAFDFVVGESVRTKKDIADG